ncbi:MAG: hypothetical protein HC794_09370 [Nitrospiraceae bacterium]|nr:hypothetical protein [Nitrospiraceae bacterium]
MTAPSARRSCPIASAGDQIGEARCQLAGRRTIRIGGNQIERAAAAGATLCRRCDRCVVPGASAVISEQELGTAELELLEEIESAATRAAELTKQLLAYSGKGKFVVQRLDVIARLEFLAEAVGALHEGPLSPARSGQGR